MAILDSENQVYWTSAVCKLNVTQVIEWLKPGALEAGYVHNCMIQLRWGSLLSIQRWNPKFHCSTVALTDAFVAYDSSVDPVLLPLQTEISGKLFPNYRGAGNAIDEDVTLANSSISRSKQGRR